MTHNLLDFRGNWRIVGEDEQTLSVQLRLLSAPFYLFYKTRILISSIDMFALEESIKKA